MKRIWGKGIIFFFKLGINLSVGNKMIIHLLKVDLIFADKLFFLRKRGKKNCFFVWKRNVGLLIKIVMRIGKERYVHRIFNESKIVYNYDLKIRQEMNIEIRREKKLSNLDSEGTSNKSLSSY